MMPILRHGLLDSGGPIDFHVRRAHALLRARPTAAGEVGDVIRDLVEYVKPTDLSSSEAPAALRFRSGGGCALLARLRCRGPGSR
jgi:hypothetical protein